MKIFGENENEKENLQKIADLEDQIFVNKIDDTRGDDSYKVATETPTE